MKIILLILALSTSVVSALFPQQNFYHFENIGVDQGLSHPNVRAIYRDRKGFLWIGTTGGGLNCFDGHEMKVYKHNDLDSTSICNNNIRNIIEDENGAIWVATEVAISRLNRLNGRFDNYTLANGRLTNSWDVTIYQDNQNHIWAVGAQGIERFDPASNRFTSLPASQQLTGLTSIVMDKSGDLLMGSLENGLKRYNPVTGEVHTYLPYQKEVTHFAMRDKNSCILRMDKCGNIWVGSGGVREDFSRFHVETGAFETGHTPAANFSGMAETTDFQGNRLFWMISVNELYRIKLDCADMPEWGKGKEYIRINQSNSNLPGTGFTCMYADAQNNIWLGTPLHGVWRISNRQERIQTYQHVKDGTIIGIRFTPTGDALICGHGNPLTITDKRLVVKKKFDYAPPHIKNEYTSTSWDAVYHPDDGLIYISSYWGHTVYDEKTGKSVFRGYEKYKSTPSEPTNFMLMLPVEKNRLVQTIWNGFAFWYDITSHEFIKKASTFPILPRNLKQAPDKKVWLCAEGWLLRFDPETYARDTLFGPEANANFYDVLWDKNKHAWLATNHGLWSLDDSNHVSRKYDIPDGLPDHLIKDLTFDALDRLWMCTNFGVGYYEPSRGKFHYLSKSDGFDFRYDQSVLAKAPDGLFWLSNGNDISVFTPESFESLSPSKVLITGLKINDRDTFFQQAFDQLGPVKLRPGENVLSFSFTAPDLEIFGKTRFLYRLEGLNDRWLNAGKSLSATFVKVPAGTYTFRVRPGDAGDSDKYDATLTIIVTNYFWERQWFRFTMLAVLIAFGFFSYIRWNRQRTRLRMANLERLQAVADSNRRTAESEMKALRAQMNPHFVFNSLNSINAYILRNLPAEASRYLTKFAGLMRQILDNSAQEAITLEEELHFLEAYLQAESMRLEQKLNYTIDIDESIDPTATHIPSMILQPFLENAIWHGIANKPEGGTILIHIGKKDNTLHLCIQDNGIGRALSQQINNKRTQTHESKGMKITLERLALYDQKNNTHTEIRITDLQEPTGTKVDILIAKNPIA